MSDAVTSHVTCLELVYAGFGFYLEVALRHDERLLAHAPLTRRSRPLHFVDCNRNKTTTLSLRPRHRGVSYYYQ